MRMRGFGLFLPVVALATSACSQSASDNGSAEAPVEKPVAFASLKGDPVRGKTVFLQCQACHSSDPGRNMIGPTLHGIVGSKAGDVPGFSFSAPMKGSGIVWTGEELYGFLAAPQAKVPGTRMSFGGIQDAQSRADLIAYLATLK